MPPILLIAAILGVLLVAGRRAAVGAPPPGADLDGRELGGGYFLPSQAFLDVRALAGRDGGGDGIGGGGRIAPEASSFVGGGPGPGGFIGEPTGLTPAAPQTVGAVIGVISDAAAAAAQAMQGNVPQAIQAGARGGQRVAEITGAPTPSGPAAPEGPVSTTFGIIGTLAGIAAAAAAIASGIAIPAAIAAAAAAVRGLFSLVAPFFGQQEAVITDPAVMGQTEANIDPTIAVEAETGLAGVAFGEGLTAADVGLAAEAEGGPTGAEGLSPSDVGVAAEAEGGPTGADAGTSGGDTGGPGSSGGGTGVGEAGF